MSEQPTTVRVPNLMTDPKSSEVPPAKTKIRSRLEELLKDDRKRRTEALREISKQTGPAFRALETECGETGHKWTFDHWNFNYEYAWDKCEWCGAVEGAVKHGGESQ